MGRGHGGEPAVAMPDGYSGRQQGAARDALAVYHRPGERLRLQLFLGRPAAPELERQGGRRQQRAATQPRADGRSQCQVAQGGDHAYGRGWRPR
jgi:hypothetical protein